VAKDTPLSEQEEGKARAFAASRTSQGSWQGAQQG